MMRSLLLCLVLAWAVVAPVAMAQEPEEEAQTEGEAVELVEDQPAGALRPKPDLSNVERLRFVTDSDYPPFNYLDEDGVLTGFNVDLARTICTELSLDCDVRPVEWDALLPALANDEADAAIASLRVDENVLRQVDFTESYYHTPARFVAREASPVESVTPEGLAGRKVGALKGTAHEVFLRDFFTQSEIVIFEDPQALKEALKEAQVDLIFGDGITLMFWINGTASNACCEFRGGPFTEARYFGEGVGIAVNHGNRRMREILDYGLEQVRLNGRFEELLLRYFPMSFF